MHRETRGEGVGSISLGIIAVLAARLIIGCLLLAPSLHAAEDLAAQAKQARERAIAALLKKQAADGGWHSEDYAVFKNGAALTALALDAFSRLPEAERAPLQAQLDKALAFLHKTQNKAGGLGFGADWSEYPVYTTALAVTAVVRLKPDGWKELTAPWVAWLKSQQYVAPKWTEDDAVYGGWSPHGISNFGPHDRADISTTRHVLVALRDANIDKDELLWPRALKFLQRCQNLRTKLVSVETDLGIETDAVSMEGDGGFCYAPGNQALNKAGIADTPSGFKSYDTATADGLWANVLLQPRAANRAGNYWFQARIALSKNKFPEPDVAGLRFYHRAVLLPLLDLITHRAVEIRAHAIKLTLQDQAADGLWRNPVDTMKENDPLLASLLALQVLLPENAK